MLRTLPVDPTSLVLVAAGQPDAVPVWEERDGRRQLVEGAQESNDDGVPLWTCYLMPTAGATPEVMQVRVPAQHQPVLTMLGPVHVVGLEVNVRVDKAGKLAQYWAAAEVRDAGQPGRKNGHQGHHGEQKAEQAA